MKYTFALHNAANKCLCIVIDATRPESGGFHVKKLVMDNYSTTISRYLCLINNGKLH